MYNFILKRKPISYNTGKGTKKINYKTALEKAFKSYNPNHDILIDDLYATIYYFFNTNLNLDTDNLSKPVWDALCGLLYHDDKQIKIRTAGSFNLTTGDYNIVDFSGLEGSIIIDLLDAFETEEHIVYVECGKLKSSMYKFNLE